MNGITKQGSRQYSWSQFTKYGLMMALFLAGYTVGRMERMVEFSMRACMCSQQTSNSQEEGRSPESNEKEAPATVGLGLLNTESLIGKSVWDVLPMEHTEHVEFWPGLVTDAFNPFHNYLRVLGNYQQGHQAILPELPLFHTWPHYFEAYHNHFHRFRGAKPVVFMEVGVQSGGKIAAMRDYFGPGFEYVGIDINPSTRKFDAPEWVSIEIGDSSNREFWAAMKAKYPHVDIFLDDGGHTMNQQRTALEVMLPHLQPEGVFLCEDLSTSWSTGFGGIPNADSRDPQFMDKTTVGLIHRSIDWFMAGWRSGGLMTWTLPPTETFQQEWWIVVAKQVKHIHLYNQLVVYEKGLYFVPRDISTTGTSIPYKNSGDLVKTDWSVVLSKLKLLTESTWEM